MEPLLFQGHFAITAILIGIAIGAVIGFVGTVIADYADDGDVFNGSISAEDYVANTLVGGLIGGLTGGIGSSTFTLTLPTLDLVTTSIGTTVLVGGTATVAISGTSILAGAGILGSVVMFASNNRPGDNKKQNKQFRDAMRELDITDRDQMRRVHDRIKGKNMGYNELIDFIKEVLNLK